ncbi:MAG TPA: DUF1848 family protein, partial [Rhodospirillaceae bacterium]|nr:DUF1848 family protein [Rhodospirillaceae bacterium]
GHCLVANPYGGPPGRVALRDGVDGYVFWTRNIAPFLDALDLVAAAGLPFVVHYTLTGYPRRLERRVAEAGRSIDAIAGLVSRFGGGGVVWRYDPILLSELTPADWHIDNFTRLADRLAGLVDEVAVSWLDLYRKTLRNLKGLGQIDPPAEQKSALLRCLAAIAETRGIRLTLCTEPDLAQRSGLAEARCIDAERLGRRAGRAIAARHKGNRPGCLCAESRDIGAYDSCPHGCVYCYAVASAAAARARFRAHDPNGDFLTPSHRLDSAGPKKVK